MGNVILSLKQDTARELVEALRQLYTFTRWSNDAALLKLIEGQTQPQLREEVKSESRE